MNALTAQSRNNLSLLLLMELFAGASRGAYLVCIGWGTLVITGDVARVGQVFVVSMLTIMLAGPLIGVIVDRYDRRKLTILAHLLITVTMVIFGLVLSGGGKPALVWFFIAVALLSSFRLAYQVAHDGLIHANVQTAEMVTVLARFRALHLLATALGTVATGMIIARYSPGGGFLFAGGLSLLLIVPVLFVKGRIARENPPGFSGFVADLVGGWQFFRGNRTVRAAVILTGVALPVGQLSNAVLSSFIRDDLGLGSDVFGLIDGAWPFGGMLAALALALGLRRLGARNIEYGLGVLVGVFTVVFSMTSSIVALIAIHAAMGFLVWLCNIIIDGRVLQTCEAENVGRAKTYVYVMYSLSALIMVLSPTLVRLPNTSDYFLYWGIFISIGTVLLWLGRKVA